MPSNPRDIRIIPPNSQIEKGIPTTVAPSEYIEACIDTEEPIQLKLRQPVTTAFRYTLGNPPGYAFTLAFYRTEQDRLAKINPLTDVYIIQEIKPEKPITKQVRFAYGSPNFFTMWFNGFTRLTAMSDEYKILYATISILQPDSFF